MELLFYLELFKWGLLAGICFAISTALTAPFLVLQRNSLFPHAITHILLLSLLLLSLFKDFFPVFLEFPFLLTVTLFLSYLIYFLARTLHLFEDTSTSILTYLSLGLALLIAGKTSQFDVTLLNYLFGSFLTVDKKDYIESFFVLILTLILFYHFKDLWLAKCFEEEIPGIELKKSQALFLLLITLQSIVGVKLMGVLLVSSFFVFSSATALKISSSFAQAIYLSVFFNLLSLLFGFILSIHFDFPFSGAVVIFMGLYILGLFFLKRS
ncbi:MAG: metal ABC transporter permease [Caldimicrobium sp.]